MPLYTKCLFYGHKHVQFWRENWYKTDRNELISWHCCCPSILNSDHHRH